MTDRRYTPEQIQDAERVAKALTKIPEEKREYATTMIISFIRGMEAQSSLDRIRGERVEA